jgi:hypothetical protein
MEVCHICRDWCLGLLLCHNSFMTCILQLWKFSLYVKSFSKQVDLTWNSEIFLWQVYKQFYLTFLMFVCLSICHQVAFCVLLSNGWLVPIPEYLMFYLYLCPRGECVGIHFWGGGTNRADSITLDDRMIAKMIMTGRRDLQFNVDSRPW